MPESRPAFSGNFRVCLEMRHDLARLEQRGMNRPEPPICNLRPLTDHSGVTLQAWNAKWAPVLNAQLGQFILHGVMGLRNRRGHQEHEAQ